MKLNRWIKTNGWTQKTFFEECRKEGADFSVHALMKWCNGQRIPRSDEMALIHKMTKGQVQPNDFYCLTDSQINGLTESQISP